MIARPDRVVGQNVDEDSARNLHVASGADLIPQGRDGFPATRAHPVVRLQQGGRNLGPQSRSLFRAFAGFAVSKFQGLKLQ